jgi:hypothetical protein
LCHDRRNRRNSRIDAAGTDRYINIVAFQSANPDYSKRIVVAAIISFILGSLLLCLNNFWHCPALFSTFLFFSFFVAPILGIIAAVHSFPRKNALLGSLRIGLIFVLSTVALITGRMLLVIVLPYIYTPPALTADNLQVYNRCIQFAKKHGDDKTLVLGRGARVLINGKLYMLSPGNVFERNRARKVFSEDEITQMETLCRQLYAVRCAIFKRDNDILLFYRMANAILPIGPLDVGRILPIGPGVAYSLAGRNPNEIESGVPNTKKLFVKIIGNWYMSRRLILVGPRSAIAGSIPKSLIDHSLRTEGLDLDDRADKNIVYEMPR